MHNYNVPDTNKASKTELDQLRDIADEFGYAAMKAFRGPKQFAVMQAIEPEEGATLQGMAALIDSPDARGNTMEEWISLQMIDIQVAAMQRVDAAETDKCIPASMATKEAADLFQKYDLPEMEKLARKSIKPPTP